MANTAPWLDWGWLKVGPVLTNEEERRAYEAQRSAPAAPQQGPTMEDYIRAQRENAINSYNWTMEEQRKRDLAQRGPAPDRGSPSLFERFYYGPKRANERYGISDETTPMQTIVPDGAVPAGPQAPAAPDQKMYQPRLLSPQTDAQPLGGIPEQQSAPDTPAPVDPIEAIRQQKAMIDAIYPQRPQMDAGYDAVDANMEKERQRMEIMARLAFFSGITKAAGGSWESVGEGLGNAAGVYSQGFERYQQALERKAERMNRANDQRYADEVGRSDAAIGLYKQQQDLEKSRMTDARQRIKDRMSYIDDYFKERLKLAKGTDLEPADPVAVDKIMKEWQISRERGDIVYMNKLEGK